MKSKYTIRELTNTTNHDNFLKINLNTWNAYNNKSYHTIPILNLSICGSRSQTDVIKCFRRKAPLSLHPSVVRVHAEVTCIGGKGGQDERGESRARVRTSCSAGQWPARDAGGAAAAVAALASYPSTQFSVIIEIGTVQETSWIFHCNGLPDYGFICMFKSYLYS